MSLSARRAWIEMHDCKITRGRIYVALRKESVDRNMPNIGTLRSTHVALRKESVDRNKAQMGKFLNQCKVALRKESVDRNTSRCQSRTGLKVSLSARRAWIEMCNAPSRRLWSATSLSARRAWIEIQNPARYPRGCFPSLSARRAWIEIVIMQ